jgi:UDPglucose 6-dehydrogenase
MKKNIFLLFVILAMGKCAAHHTVAVLGAGYVGLITSVCLAKWGHTVICIDTDQEKINRLNQGIMPIYEVGLKELVDDTTQAGTLSFTTNDQMLAYADCIIIAVGTPMNTDGNADMTALYATIDMIASHLSSYKVICVKSTVPIGTGASIKTLLMQKGIDESNYDLVSNPEFLKEGSAIADCMDPDRIVIGAYSQKAFAMMDELYETLTSKGIILIKTSIESAETIKYASNAFLATKISFINEIANLCEKTGADIVDVAKGMGLDKRIGSAFLKPGPGFGGSCFPKDCHALVYIAHNKDTSLQIVQAAIAVNEAQKHKPFQKLVSLLEGQSLEQKRVVILGLAFKANTDDVRSSAAITLIQELFACNAQIIAYDPAAMENMKKIFPTIMYADAIDKAFCDADAIVIMTEWDEFKDLDWHTIGDQMKQRIVVDARNITDPTVLQENGFIYAMMGR